jgi:Flp pilus assembly protein protease CpaA
MVAAFLLFEVGGGDVKLLAMEGAWLGLERGLECLLWTFVIGGAVALAILVWKLGTWNLVKAVSRHLLWSLRLGRAIPLSVEEKAALQPPLYLAVAAVPALCIVALDLAGTHS